MPLASALLLVAVGRRLAEGALYPERTIRSRKHGRELNRRGTGGASDKSPTVRGGGRLARWLLPAITYKGRASNCCPSRRAHARPPPSLLRGSGACLSSHEPQRHQARVAGAGRRRPQPVGRAGRRPRAGAPGHPRHRPRDRLILRLGLERPACRVLPRAGRRRELARRERRCRDRRHGAAYARARRSLLSGRSTRRVPSSC